MIIAVRSMGARLRRLPRFLVVGGVATAVQYAILVVLVEVVGVTATVASTVGFVASAALNYRVNYTYTFSSSVPHSIAVPRFLATACIGLILNSTVMFLLAEILSVQYIVSQIVATGIALGWNFFVHQAWSFNATKMRR
jgi:putative flippase GtrA